eukprot:31303-Pelagococcus_subviridis.AAC.3
MGSGRANELCALRIVSLFEMASPFKSASNSAVNSFMFASSAPSVTLGGQFIRMDRIACVAHAFVMTWLAKKTPFAFASVSTGALGGSPLRHLNRKMRPYTGLRDEGGRRGGEGRVASDLGDAPRAG